MNDDYPDYPIVHRIISFFYFFCYSLYYFIIFIYSDGGLDDVR